MFDMIPFPTVTVFQSQLTTDPQLQPHAVLALHELLLDKDPFYLCCNVIAEEPPRAQFAFENEAAARHFMEIMKDVKSFEEWMNDGQR